MKALQEYKNRDKEIEEARKKKKETMEKCGEVISTLKNKCFYILAAIPDCSEARSLKAYIDRLEDNPFGSEENTDGKIDLIKRMQEELEHRSSVEEKAVQLICDGRQGEAVEMLNFLDDSVIAEMHEEALFHVFGSGMSLYTNYRRGGKEMQQ